MNFFSDDRMAELRQLFFESAQEILQALNEEALRLEKAPQDAEIVRSIRRAVHTLKGDSAAVGFRELSQIAHELEDALVPEVTSVAPSGDLVELVLSSADTFDAILAAHRGSLPLPSVEPLRAAIAKLRPGGAGKTQVPSRAFSAPLVSWSEYQQMAIEQALQRGKTVYRIAADLDPNCPMKAAAWQLFHNVLQRAGEVLAVQPENAAAEQVSHFEVVISSEKPEAWITDRCLIPAVIAAVKVTPWKARQPGQPPAAESSAPQAAAALENILRVDAERLDQLLNLIGELIIGRSMLQQVLSDFSRRFPKDSLRARFADAMAFQTRVLNDLQRSAMQVRMVPVEQLFRRFPRLVRDVGKQCGKEVALLLSGQQTELDKSILDAIAEPLAHLVRNAIDHGLESPEERQKAGKPAKGTIRLNAYHQGNHVVIEVADDGRGLDPALILSKALERGLLSSDEAARLSPAEVLELIFRPGFTTAEQVTEISGRGVGMDVVQSVVHRLKGAISIQSQPGQGATFVIKLPLTLAIIKSLLLRIQERLYAIPLNAVVEISRASEGAIHRVDNHEVLQLRNTVLTLVRLGSPPSEFNPGRRIFVVVIALGERRYGLIVDTLVGEEELVIKPLDGQVIASELVGGASILGDGTVVLMLNLVAVVEHYSRQSLAPLPAAPAQLTPPPSPATRVPGGAR
ncbi:MAG TPA: chemotaxis protein CheA [Terriglobales bacterium]|nr:chemotaxis protein CheA [Terriglobales bacterium]